MWESFIQHDIENKQLKEENKKLNVNKNENENDKLKKKKKLKMLTLKINRRAKRDKKS